MRVLTSLRREHRRLGWLRVLAETVGDEAVEVNVLKTTLKQISDTHFDDWRVERFGETAPRAGIGPKKWGGLIRFGVDLGVYDITVHRLTDLGHMFRAGAPWPNGTNPFKWSASAQWIGWRVYFAAMGDLLRLVLRDWPGAAADSQCSDKQALGLIQAACRELMSSAKDSQFTALDRWQAKPPNRHAFELIVQPILEPLRELGFLERWHDKQARLHGYHPTGVGRRLIAAFAQNTKDADALLKSGLARLTVEALIGEARPADRARLIDVLRALPLGLQVSEREAPLDAVAALFQVKLLEVAPGEYADLADVEAMVQRAGQRGAQVSLKQGGTVREGPNLAWASDEALDEAFAPQQLALSDVSPAAAEAPAPPPFVPVPLWDPTVPERARWWISLALACLQPPRSGDEALARWQGPVGCLERLARELPTLEPNRLKARRTPEGLFKNSGKDSNPTCWQVSEWTSLLKAPPAARRFETVWSDKQSPDFSGALQRVRSWASSLKLAAEIGAWLESSDPIEDQTLIQGKTRALILDQSEVRGRHVLLTALYRQLGSQPAVQAAQGWLNALNTPDTKDYRFVQPFDVLKPIVEAFPATSSEAIRDGEPPFILHREAQLAASGSPRMRLEVVVKAVSEANARHLGRLKVEAIQRALLASVGSDTLFTVEDVLKNGPDYDLVDDQSERIEVEADDDARRDDSLFALNLFEPPRVGSLMGGGGFAAPPDSLEGDRRRLALGLHGLAAADRQATPIFQIERAWGAMEQMVAGSSKGPDTIRLIAPVMSLLWIRDRYARIWNDFAQALTLRAALQPGTQSHIDDLEEWLGPIEEAAALIEKIAKWRGLSESLRTQHVLARQLIVPAVAPGAAVRALHGKRTDLETWAGKVASSSLAALNLRAARDELEDLSTFEAHFERTINDVNALLHHVYAVRNIVQHDGHTFEGALINRHADTYLRLRALLRPVLHWSALQIEAGHDLLGAWWAMADRAEEVGGKRNGKTNEDKTLDWPRLAELLALEV